MYGMWHALYHTLTSGTNLLWKFSCRSTNETNRTVTRLEFSLVHYVNDQWPDICGGLTTAGLGNTNDVTATQSDRHTLHTSQTFLRTGFYKLIMWLFPLPRFVFFQWPMKRYRIHIIIIIIIIIITHPTLHL